MATTIPTLSPGAVFTAAEFNTLDVLNTGVGLLGATASLLGTTPGVTAPNFSLVIGTDVQSTNGGGGAVTTFPVPFANGVLAIIACYGDNSMSGSGWLSVINSQVSKTGFGWEASGSPSQAIRINYIACGY